MDESNRNAAPDLAGIVAFVSGLAACTLVALALASVGWRKSWWEGPTFSLCFWGVILAGTGSVGWGNARHPPLRKAAGFINLFVFLAGVLTGMVLVLLLIAADP